MSQIREVPKQALIEDDSVVTFGATDESLATHLNEGSLRICARVPALRPDMLGLFGMGHHWSQTGGVFGIWVSPRGGLMLRHRTHDTSLFWEGPAEFCGAGDELRVSYLIWTSLGRGRYVPKTQQPAQPVMRDLPMRRHCRCRAAGPIFRSTPLCRRHGFR